VCTAAGRADFEELGMKFTIIGAGSGFGSRLSVDVLSRAPLADSTIALCDIDEKKLATVGGYVQRVIDGNDLPARVETSTDRREVLPGSDFVVISVAIGGPAYYDHPYESEMEIPLKYGVHQTVGDTVGPGGIFRGLRTGPELVAMTRDINRLAPKATIINYTNPMAILTWVLNEVADVPVVGLCHSVQGTAKRLASFIAAPFEEVGHWVAGINHMSWFLEFTHRGEDAYPRLRDCLADPETFAKDPVRFEVMEHFGRFVTESSRHMSEYVPYYQHRPELMDSMVLPRSKHKQKRQAWLEDMGVKADQRESIELVRSHEYASGIAEASVTNQPMRFNGNVTNAGLIANLPTGCCVEVPCMVDRDGIHPCAVGDLPAQCAALCRANVAVQQLTVRAILERDAESAYHALCLDPATSAVLPLARIRELFDEMWEAEGDLLADYVRPRRLQPAQVG
jgi:alpha-galactosidase